MLIELFGKCPQVKVINYLLAHPFHKYTKKEIAEGSEISRMTLDKFIQQFVELQLLIKEQGAYRLNRDSLLVNLMDKLQEVLSDMESEKQLEKFQESSSKLSDAQLDGLLSIDEKDTIFDENEELVFIERKELKRLRDLENQYNTYAQKQMELASELLKVMDSSKKELSHL